MATKASPNGRSTKNAKNGKSAGNGKQHARRDAEAQQVRDVMSTDPVCLIETDTVMDAAQAMRENRVGDVIVLDDTTALIKGIVTDRDIVMRCVAEGKRPEQTTLGSVASTDLTCLAPGDDVQDAVRLMRERAIRRLPVADGGKPVGFLSLGDLAVERDPESVLAQISQAPANA